MSCSLWGCIKARADRLEIEVLRFAIRLQVKEPRSTSHTRYVAQAVQRAVATGVLGVHSRRSYVAEDQVATARCIAFFSGGMDTATDQSNHLVPSPTPRKFSVSDPAANGRCGRSNQAPVAHRRSSYCRLR